ncbi:MAG TPA: DNA polymerase III subunit gamma/tau [Smithellaceae bacterium]|nr:DNA polymerase III subunit gamma/tau [Smithellaceae bacterium]
MEYLVLARKFRPQNFEEVAGQEHVVKTLRNAIAQGRVAHAFLFSGPRGVGKTSVARILAKSLNCEKGPTAVPCNVCPNCREITEGSSLDVREIDGASNRGIDEIRELRENVRFAPAAAKYKIYIIDEVHMLTREAFNALLKTLEEPPAHVIFIFATTENFKVPATILSRCQCYDFRRISLKEIAANLGNVAAAEKIKISPTALSWIAEAGDGSMRDSQSIFDQVISYAGIDIADADVEEILGLVDRKYLFRLSEAILKQDAGAGLMILEEAYLAGIDMRHFYSMLLRHFRNMMLVKIAGASSSSFDIAPEQIEKMQVQTEGATRESIQRYVEILIAEEGSFHRSQEPRLKLETIIVKMAYLEPIIPLGEIVSTLEALEQKLARSSGQDSGNASISKKTIPAPAAAPEVEKKNIPVLNKAENTGGQMKAAADLMELCNNFKIFLKRENPLLAAKMDSAEFLSCGKGRLELGFPKDYIFLDDISEKSQREKLEQAASKFLQEETAVKIREGQTEKAADNGGNGRSKTLAINDIKREAMNHPLLQKILSEFASAEIIEIKARTDKK